MIDGFSYFRSFFQALHQLRSEGLLDPYQALTHGKYTVRKANAPLIDFLTAKYRHLTKLLDEQLEKPIDDFKAASTAFVTLKDSHSLKRVLRELSSHPMHALACKTKPAPDYVDLLWPKLSKSVYRDEAVRSWAMFFIVWIFTITWL